MLFKKSEWIWNKNALELNSFVDFQISFSGNQQKKYTLFISACCNYMVTLNSKYIPSAQREGFECLPEYQIIDLSDSIMSGENEIVITVYSQGEDSFIWRKRPAGLIFELQEDGKVISVSSEKTLSRVSNKFISGDMEKISSMLGFTFKADLTKRPNTFANESCVVNKNKNLVKRAISDLEVFPASPAEIIAQGEFIDKSPSDVPLGKRAYNAFLSSKIITEIAQNTFIGLYNNTFCLDYSRSYLFNTSSECDGIYLTLDLGQNTVGYPCFDIEVFEDARMVVSYGEHIYDMRPRSCPAGYQFAYEVKLKAGKNSFIFPFRRTACRYFMALIYTNKADISYIGMRECIYPIEKPSVFSCSDSLHEKIFKVAQRTLRLCMHDHYEDCPSREQAMYIMDTQIQAVCGYYALGEYTFPKSSFEMLLNSFREDNFFEMITPGVSKRTIPCFSINFIPLIWEYYLFSGDLDMLNKAYPYMKLTINERLEHLDSKTGLIPSPCGEKFWNFTEWQKGNDGVVGKNDDTCLDYELFNMSYYAFYALVCAAYSKVCREIGKTAEAEFFESFLEKLKAAVHENFWNESRKAYKSVISFERDLPVYYTELANALAVCAEICPKECIESALESLASGELETITISHARYKYDALMKMNDKYGDYVMKEISDIWGAMLYQGATSFWETERGAKDFSLSGSQCHGWSTIPIYVYFRYCLGVYPQAPGFKKYTVEPKIFGYSFGAEFSTPEGLIVL